MAFNAWARRLALGLCGLAFALGTFALDARALWGDEAFSVWASKQSALALIGGLDAQPPPITWRWGWPVRCGARRSSQCAFSL
jgi:hypothetical protein